MKRIVTITCSEENEFEGSVLESSCQVHPHREETKIPDYQVQVPGYQVQVLRVRGEEDCDHHQQGRGQAHPEGG